MISKVSKISVAGAVASILAACGGGGGTSATTPPVTTQTSQVAMLVSDASTEDWAAIGVKILSIALVPQGGGSNVTIYTAPSPVPVTNLAQLDQLGELIGNATVGVGTYTAAVLTVGANPGDVILNVAADPESGFAGTAGAAIPSDQIQIQRTQGTAPNLTVPVTIKFVAPLVVTTTSSNQLDLEFDLGHPAFIVGHTPVGADGTTIWAVNFDPQIVHHHPIGDITRLVLRHMYGEVTAISSDSSSITITKEYPTEPVVNPETAVASGQSVQIEADSVNGTIFYDVDAGTRTTIMGFSGETSLVGRYVRIAARYQENGTLVATRIWASNTFSPVWVSPEGHVLHVNASTDIVTIENESGVGVPVTVNADTQFFFRQPWNAVADGTPIMTGTTFLTDDDLVRGFKVHISVVDPLATPLVAQTIDIETARYDGTISYPVTTPPTTGFTYTRNFHTSSDDYVYALDYISSSTANGDDFNSPPNPITGYKWWNFAYPISTLMTGSTAVADWVSATNGAVDFAGSVATVPAYGVSFATWADPANPSGWSAYASIVDPSSLPLGAVAAGGYGNNAFPMTVNGGMNAVTINVSTTTGSATLVYQVDRTNGVVTVSPIDITTSTGLAAMEAGLAVGAPVKVYGVPQSNGSLNAYVLTYFTGDAPAN